MLLLYLRGALLCASLPLNIYIIVVIIAGSKLRNGIGMLLISLSLLDIVQHSVYTFFEATLKVRK